MLAIGTTLIAGCLAGPRHYHPRAVGVAAATEACPCAATNAVATSQCPTELAPFAPVPPPPSALPVAVDDAPAVDAATSDTSVTATAVDSAEPPLVFAAGAAPALSYAALDGNACESELKKRSISYTVVAGGAFGVDRPVRLTGKLHGVDVHGMGPASQRATSIYEIVDCRLVLALDDFSVILAKHDVVEVEHMSIYRPGAKDQKTKKQHEGALAIDLGALVKKDGTRLTVLADWHGGIGTKTCGPGAGPWPATKPALELRTILCDTSDAKLFNVMLTPNYNKPHENHFHLEVTRGVKWFLLH